MGQTPKKRAKSGEGVTVKEIVYWMLSTFGWTYEEVCNLDVEYMYYIMDGAQIYNEKQMKEMKKSHGNRPGKYSVDSLSQLVHTPGVKTIKRK